MRKKQEYRWLQMTESCKLIMSMPLYPTQGISITLQQGKNHMEISDTMIVKVL